MNKERCECHECTQARISRSSLVNYKAAVEPEKEREETDSYIKERQARKAIENLTKTVQQYAASNAKLLERVSEFETQIDKKKK